MQSRVGGSGLGALCQPELYPRQASSTSLYLENRKQDLIREPPKVALLSKEMLELKILQNDKKPQQCGWWGLTESLCLGEDRPGEAPASTGKKFTDQTAVERIRCPRGTELTCGLKSCAPWGACRVWGDGEMS